MKRTALLIILMFVPVATQAQTPGLTANTLAYDSTQPRPVATLDDVAWITGHWRGPAFGGISEEIWSAPESGSMMGMYRLMKDGSPVFYEILTITPDGPSLVMSLKHFNADLTGWEEQNEVRRFRLVRITPTEAFFEGMTFRRLDADRIQVLLAVGTEEGSAEEEEFMYVRVK